MIDFSIPSELEATRDRVAAFMQQHVYPNESKMVEDEGLPVDLESELQREVKGQGLWAPNLPREWGGMGIGFIGQALVNEIIGRSVIAPRIFGSAAPDAGNAELLLIAATPEQEERYLRPLASGEVRSCFARFKVAVVIQQIYFRYVQGQTHDERFRNFDSLVRELVGDALPPS